MPITLERLQAEAKKSVPIITFADARKMLEEDQALAVDVREEDEFKSLPRLPGAVSVPRSRLEFMCDPASPSYAKELSSGKKLLVYCRSGGRALLAAKTMVDMGVGDVCLLGGIQDWVAAGGQVDE